MADLKYCVGCRNDFYNDKNPLGVKQCWSLASAQVVERFRVGWWVPQDRAENFEKVTTHDCHHEPGQYAFFSELPEHLRQRAIVELWVDDVKPAPHGIEAVTTYEEALMRLRRGDVDVLYLDYDLGSPGCRGDVLLRELVELGGTIPADVRPISANPSGREVIELTVEELRAALSVESKGGPK